jgi:ubiquitin
MKGEDSNRRDNIEREERSDDKERVPLLNQSCSNTGNII